MARRPFNALLSVLGAFVALTGCGQVSTGNDVSGPGAPASAGGAPAPQPVNQPTPIDEADTSQIANAIDALLQAEYPAGFDAANRCWRTQRGAGADTVDYCMRLLPHHVVQEGDTRSVYVALASANDINGNPDYLYGKADPGAMDAFRINVAPDGTYSMTAKGTGLLSGSAGDCGCTNAPLVRVGPHLHGWLFSAGGTWQGVSVASHALIAPVGDSIRDVAGLPRLIEDDPSLEYRLEVESSNESGGWYPLRLARYRNGVLEASRTITFDSRAERFPTPTDF